MKPECTLQIVTWNHEKEIQRLCESLQSAREHCMDVLIIDNASKDKTVEVVKRFLPHASIIQNSTNLGFSAAHNQGIHTTDTEFIALINPDIRFTEKAMRVLLHSMRENPSIGSVGGKLLKTTKSDSIIDSAGILATRKGQFTNRGEGEPDRGQYDTEEEVFGITGACIMLRREALESIRIGTEYLDEDFFAYKEDVDLAWRLRYAGWKNYYNPRAILYHDRVIRHEPLRSVVLQGRSKPTMIRQLSYRNHILLLLKNDRYSRWFFPLPYTFFFECAKFFYILFREPSTLLGLFHVFRLLPACMKKRSITLRRKKIPASAIEKWFR